MKFPFFSAAFAALLLTATAGISQPFELKGTKGGWNIFANMATNGCFMERVTNEGIVLQIGSVQAMTQAGGADDYGYVGVYVPGEAPEVSSEKPIVVVQIGPNTYIGRGTRVVREGYWGGYVVSDGENDLAFDLQNRKIMEITTQNGVYLSIVLMRSDISGAIGKVKDCQREMN